MRTNKISHPICFKEIKTRKTHKINISKSYLKNQFYQDEQFSPAIFFKPIIKL